MLPAHLSIEAVATGDSDSVAMEIDHNPSSTENLEPYALLGDTSGDFNPVPEIRMPGWITISATPYAGPDLSGVAGAEAHLHLYRHQPDFVVRDPADIGDYNPGDGWCATGPPLVFTDDLVVAAEALSEWELKLREIDAEKADAFENARTEGLPVTVGIDEKRSSQTLFREIEAFEDGVDPTIARDEWEGGGDTGSLQPDRTESTAWSDLYRWADVDLDRPRDGGVTPGRRPGRPVVLGRHPL
jgi:hypothetical protein